MFMTYSISYHDAKYDSNPFKTSSIGIRKFYQNQKIFSHIWSLQVAIVLNVRLQSNFAFFTFLLVDFGVYFDMKIRNFF